MEAKQEEAQSGDAASVPAKPWQRKKNAVASPRAGGGAGNDDVAIDDVVVATAPLKPWQKKKSAVASPKAAALAEPATAETGDGHAAAAAGVVVEGDEDVGAAAAAAAPVKPWLRKKRPVGGVELSNDDAAGVAVAVAAKPWKVAAAAKAAAEKFDDVLPEGRTALGKGDESSGGGAVGVAGLAACLEDRDWKKRVAVFEVCRSLENTIFITP